MQRDCSFPLLCYLRVAVGLCVVVRMGFASRVMQVPPVALLPLALCLVSAGWSIHAFTDTSTDKLYEDEKFLYEAAVGRWREYARRMYDAVSGVDAGVSTAPLAGVVGDVALDKVLEEDRTLSDWEGVLDEDGYSALYYEGAMQVDLGEQWEDLSSQTLVLRVGGQTLTVPGLSFGRLTVIKTTNWKACQYQHDGVLDRAAGLCYSFKVGRRVCLVLKADNTTYAPEVRWSVAGACGKNGLTADMSKAVRYTPLPVPRYISQDRGSGGGLLDGLGEEGVGPMPGVRVQFKTVVRLRSADDPLLVMQNVTDGTLRLDQSPAARQRLGWIMAGCSVICFAMLAFVVKWTARGEAGQRKLRKKGFTRQKVPREDSVHVDIELDERPQHRSDI